jgi:hypothetical protein
MSPARLAFAFIAAVSLFVFYQDRRLRALYPSLPVPPSLEIAARTARPAVGTEGCGGEQWRRTDAGDVWIVDVPVRLLSSFRLNESGSVDASEADLATQFAESFWSSLPLKVERVVLVWLMGKNWGPFQARDGLAVSEAEAKGFRPGTRLLDGLVTRLLFLYPRLVSDSRTYLTISDSLPFLLCPAIGQFVVEAHDQRPETAPDGHWSGHIIASWWLKTEPAREPPPFRGLSEDHSTVSSDPAEARQLLGGHHSFAAKMLPSLQSEEPTVRLYFVSHLVLSSLSTTSISTHPPARATTSPPTLSLRGLTLKQSLIMHFHHAYSRILMDCAVRALKRRGQWVARS